MKNDILSEMVRTFYSISLANDVDNMIRDKSLEIYQKYYNEVKLNNKKIKEIQKIFKEELKKLL